MLHSQKILHSTPVQRSSAGALFPQPSARHRSAPCRAAGGTSTSTKSRTQEVFESVDRRDGAEAGGAGGRTSFAAFQAAEAAWTALRNMPEGAAAGPAPQFVRVQRLPLKLSAPGAPTLYDVVVCGGTLGVFAAVALQRAGLSVALLERGPLRGRQQEWNLSRKELHELAEAGIATTAELDECVNKEFNPVRAGFYPDVEVWTRDVLNLGVSPDRLVSKMRALFESAGGQVLENTALQGISVHPDGCRLAIQPPGPAEPTALHARLVIDCMGHGSPVVKQMRWGRKPDGVCVVVGTLAAGFEDNTSGDVILTNTHLQPLDAETSNLQYFWEAFPAGSGATDRTTYMFSYLDAQPWRPTLLSIFEDYWNLMPKYQGVELDKLEVKRVLFGTFPTFRDSPLKPGFDRVLQIGDASGIQSPLSFGGFGALTRHLKRLTTATCEALAADLLDAGSLALIHPYNPSLSSAWMLQRAMSVPDRTRPPPPDLINRLLGNNFKAMEDLGEAVMKPFLQDVIQPGALLQTLMSQMTRDPLGIPPLLLHVGPGPLLDWSRHFAAMALYSGLHSLAAPPLRRWMDAPTADLTPRQRYSLRRMMESWEGGSGNDYRP